MPIGGFAGARIRVRRPPPPTPACAPGYPVPRTPPSLPSCAPPQQDVVLGLAGHVWPPADLNSRLQIRTAAELEPETQRSRRGPPRFRWRHTDTRAAPRRSIAEFSRVALPVGCRCAVRLAARILQRPKRLHATLGRAPLGARLIAQPTPILAGLVHERQAVSPFLVVRSRWVNSTRPSTCTVRRALP